ncbi:MAG: thiamine-phosphate kinase [Gemmatimonadales bacterium]|nr:thiamine-phosphate kinase [Gemmatimonadales bacterium]
MTNLIAMGSGGEFDRIRAIVAALGDAAGPIGDDTAAIPVGEGELRVSTDVSVEEVHFRRDWLALDEIGWRATASALSDLAATAAEPAGITIALTIPDGTADGDVVQVMRGVGAAAAAAGCQLLGGDMSGGGMWSLAVTVFGHAVRPLSRRGARPGDGIWVSGVLGGARAALLAWQDGREPAPAARLAFARPQPRLAAGRWLASRGATAMLDLSDGLGGDAEHLAAASGVGLEIELDRLPIHPSVHAEARRIDQPAAEFAAIGGEDYELLVALPEGVDGAACEPGAGVPLTRIGTVVAGSGVRCLLAGRAIAVAGFRHHG